MEYHEAANFLFDLGRYQPRTGVESTRELLAHLGDPQADLPAVQVAGSNGKGSTARMVERALREAGLTVGLFTSPHLSDLRERVRVDGRPVSKGAVCEFVETVSGYVTERAAEGVSPTFFETTTALALWAFDRGDVDVAVLEVGIGGRHDATSAVDPVASAVTTVTVEHADLLGDTVAEIARDKAHVAPADRPLVTAAEGDALAAVREIAGEALVVGESGLDADEAGDDGGVRVTYRGRKGLEGAVDLAGDGWALSARLALLGGHQARNAGVAAALCRQVASALDVALEPADLARGLRAAHWPGRFEVMETAPLVVLDGAHNPGGCAELAATLAEFEYDDLHLVVGAMADKDHAGMAAALPRTARAYACRPPLDRAESPAVLAAAFEEEADDVERRGAVADALAAARDRAGPDDCVLVTGSLFTVAEAREEWTRTAVPKRLPDRPSARAALADADVPAGTRRRLADDGVFRAVETRVHPDLARRLRAELADVGGACAVSGVDPRGRDPVDVVLFGTVAQLEAVAGRLDEDGAAGVAAAVRGALDADGAAPAAGSAAGARGSRGYPWESGTAVMGILNVTPDSFHDGGRYEAVEDAVTRADEMIEAGASLVDVGGESTRPGAEPVPTAEERERVVPVVERLADRDALVSVDTRKAEVARAALEAGADVLNDVSGLSDPEMRLVAAERDAPVVVMHSVEAPVDPDTRVEYDDVVEDVLAALTERVLLAEKAGLSRSQIIVDPGLGFGKRRHESFELLGRLSEFRALGCPVLVGHSHKSMFTLVGEEPGDAPDATVAATALAAMQGADIVRVHDVAANVRAVRTAEAARDPDRF